MRVGGIEYPDPWFLNGTAEYQHYVYQYLSPYQQSAWYSYMKPLPEPQPNPTFEPTPVPAATGATPTNPAATVGTCCLCQGGGDRNFIPGAGDVPQGTGPGVPVLNIDSPAHEIAGRIIAEARRRPINTVVY